MFLSNGGVSYDDDSVTTPRTAMRKNVALCRFQAHIELMYHVLLPCACVWLVYNDFGFWYSLFLAMICCPFVIKTIISHTVAMTLASGLEDIVNGAGRQAGWGGSRAWNAV